MVKEWSYLSSWEFVSGELIHLEYYINLEKRKRKNGLIIDMNV